MNNKLQIIEVVLASKTINKEVVCKAALELIKEDGIEQLTLRNVAKKINLQAPSLYTYMKNKEDLLAMVQAYAFKEYQLYLAFNPPAVTWQEYVASIARNMRKSFLENSWMYALFATYISNSEESHQIFEEYIQKMEAEGFSFKSAAYIARLIRVYVSGHVMLQVNESVDKSDYPHLNDVEVNYPKTYKFYVGMGGYSHDESFEFGLRALVMGCATFLEPVK